jgi:4-oxalocrotonate tautomerase
MPIIQMHLLTGRSVEQKRRVVAAVTEAAAKALDVSVNTVRILITEHGVEEFAVAGITAGERAQIKEQPAIGEQQ